MHDFTISLTERQIVLLGRIALKIKGCNPDDPESIILALINAECAKLEAEILHQRISNMKVADLKMALDDFDQKKKVVKENGI